MKRALDTVESTCHIFGSARNVGNVGTDRAEISEGDLVIAADGGYDTVRRLGIRADMLIGDLDSLDGGFKETDASDGIEVVRYPAEKDDTDAMLAVKVGLERGYERFALYGCLGGERIDHSIATLQTLAYIAEHGATGIAYYGDTRITALKSSALTLPNDLEGYLSVFAFGGECKGVTLKNVKYTLHDASLAPSFPLGVSNSFIKGRSAFISVKEGTLLAVWRVGVEK